MIKEILTACTRERSSEEYKHISDAFKFISKITLVAAFIISIVVPTTIG